MEDFLRAKRWSDFQHYAKRCPPWIKLHRKLLDDLDFQSLPVASKALAPMLWLLASESEDGTIRLNPSQLSFRLRMSGQQMFEGLNPLIEKGFFMTGGFYASTALAERLHDAIPEGERETEEIPKTIAQQKALGVILPDDFSRFWTAYPRHEGKLRALRKWRGMRSVDRAAAFDGLQAWVESGRWDDPQFVPYAVSYLNGRRWEDEITPNGTNEKHRRKSPGALAPVAGKQYPKPQRVNTGS